MSLNKRSIDSVGFTTLNVVHVVMKTLNLTYASKLLGISQPAVSSHLRRFELAVGVAPVKRVGNAMVSTSIELEGIVGELVDLQGKLSRLSRISSEDQIKLGICSIWGSGIIGNRSNYEKFSRNCNLTIDCSKKLHECFTKGEIDIVIRPSSAGDVPLLEADFYVHWSGSENAYQNDELRVVLGDPQSPFGKLGRHVLSKDQVPYRTVLESDELSQIDMACQQLEAAALVPFHTLNRNSGAKGVMFPSAEKAYAMRVGIFAHESSASYAMIESIFGLFKQLHLNPVSK